MTAALVALTIALVAGCGAPGTPPPGPSGPSPTAPPTAAQPSDGSHSPGRARLLRLLDRVGVAASTTYHPGYERDCDGGEGCVFGPPWTDDHPGAYGHNGCDTRQDVLLRQLSDIELRWDSRCRLYDGRLDDPYTGARLTWREDGYRIQVDHVYPLAAAWHAGAWAWSRQRRVRFANDVRRELLAVSARANQDKGSGTPAEWLPPNRAFRCRYLTRYLGVASAYGLTITEPDAAAVRRVAARC